LSQDSQTTPIEHRVIAVIDNFMCDVPKIEITKNLSIRHIDTLPSNEQVDFSGEERTTTVFELLKDTGESDFPPREFRTISFQSSVGDVLERTRERASYVLYWHFKERVPEPIKKHYDALLTPSQKFSSVLSALRILQDPIIGLYSQEHYFIEFPFPEQFRRFIQRPMNGYQLSDYIEDKPYILPSEHIEILKNLYSAIEKTKHPAVQVALTRLDNQYSRPHLADRLVDAVIALEALYAGNNSNEVTLRVGLRVSAHLGAGDPEARERYFELFNLAYKLRSRLVHGSIYNAAEIEKEIQKQGWKSIEAFMSSLDDLLRRALHTILLNTQGRSLETELHKPLDRSIRRGEPFKSKIHS